MCKMISCDTVGFHCFMYIYRSNVMAVMHGFTLSVLVSPLKTQKPPPLISTAWTAVLDPRAAELGGLGG